MEGILEGVAIAILKAEAILGAGVGAAVLTVVGTMILAWIADVGLRYRDLVRYPALGSVVAAYAGFGAIVAGKVVWDAIV